MSVDLDVDKDASSLFVFFEDRVQESVHVDFDEKKNRRVRRFQENIVNDWYPRGRHPSAQCNLSTHWVDKIHCADGCPPLREPRHRAEWRTTNLF